MLIRVLLCILCFISFPALAGSFKVFPLKLSFDERQKTALFRITNTGDSAVSVQLEGVKWLQDIEGEDVYEPTGDIIFFPKIVEVKQGEERVVRVAFRGSPTSQHERSYRLFAQELPQKADVNTALSFALRFSVPIFVSIPNGRVIPKLTSAEIKNRQVLISVANKGNEHALVSSISLEGFSGDKASVFQQQVKGWYVLPESQRVFKIPLSEEECTKSRSLFVKLEVGRNALQKSISLDGSQCIATKAE